jgi:hypothetical protein
MHNNIAEIETLSLMSFLRRRTTRWPYNRRGGARTPPARAATFFSAYRDANFFARGALNVLLTLAIAFIYGLLQTRISGLAVFLPLPLFRPALSPLPFALPWVTIVMSIRRLISTSAAMLD